MKKILIFLCGIMICTIFAPHDAFAKSFTVKLFESMTLDSGDTKPDEKKNTKKDTKKETKKKTAEKKEVKKKETKKKEPKKELTKAKGKKTWKKIVNPPKYQFVPE
ncbi:hypothetical protein [Candidatus Nitrosotenuis aquarius]|uniref:hypothetical protein n=1 Tax=Candidatus Nitrosotenuis aquarius TaxID=1846278 RepID=UPI0013C2A20A|nr:hypothetical protein [Candidatus Nitrosotenuis aquarius]